MLRNCYLAVLAMTLVLLAGCNSGRSTVTGTVTYDDGTPVESGIVIGDATVDGKPVSVQGMIRNGAFSWGGAKEGDGALPGQYKVIVVPPDLSEYQLAQGMTPAIDGKYGKYETSGLTFEVKPGKNVFDITVTRPKPRRKE
jgi:hypothetical protein